MSLFGNTTILVPDFYMQNSRKYQKPRIAFLYKCKVMALYDKYTQNLKKRCYKKLKDLVGRKIVTTVSLELIANFSFVPKSQGIIKQRLEVYNIDPHEFSIHFDGATFEYYPKQLKVTVYIFDHYYSFDFTKPQHLGQPLSKNTEAMLLGQVPN